MNAPTMEQLNKYFAKKRLNVRIEKVGPYKIQDGVCGFAVKVANQRDYSFWPTYLAGMGDWFPEYNNVLLTGDLGYDYFVLRWSV